MGKIKLPQVTLCCFGSEKYKKQQQNALDYSASKVEFGAVKNIIVPTNSIDEWNRAIVFDLGDYIDTDFALLIHPDSGICHPELWDDEWLKLDYIGSPFPLPTDSFSYRDVNGVTQRVGNSVGLRSKKLLRLAKKLDLKWRDWYGYYHEDGWFSVNMRHLYEENGCKFGTFEQALKFGREMPLPEYTGDTFLYHKTFGQNAIYPNFEIYEN